MARHFEHRVQDSNVVNIARAELIINHAPALGIPVVSIALQLNAGRAAGQGSEEESSNEGRVKDGFHVSR
jgi:hypothetical protein